jgi:prepilin-type N-terminal cleavage/methylation domain-containing protein
MNCPSIMRMRRAVAKGFTLVELLVVAGIIVMVMALLGPALSKGKSNAKRAVCLSNLHQINMAMRMYVEDYGDTIEVPSRAKGSQFDYHFFKEQIKSYAGLNGKPLPSEKVFACPADRFFYSAGGYHSKGLCEQPSSDFTSYAFNGLNYRGTNSETGRPYPGIAGRRISTVREPSKTVMIGEAAALTPFSWHQPQRDAKEYRFRDSRNTLSFVDGRVSYTKIYWNGAMNSEAWHYDPPGGYDYKWSGE